MEFLPAEIEEYAIRHTKPESAILEKLNRETWANVLRPRMLSGHLQGKILETFSYMMKPKRILEVGTYTGYSAICLAQGMKDGGKLFTIDINDEISHIAKKYIAASNLVDKIDFRVGDAVEIIPKLNEQWDLVFIDADKENYYTYFELVIDQVVPGGFIIADNVLWSGKVLDNYSTLDEETRSLVDFSNKVQQDDRVDNVLFPVRDGLMVIRKK